MGLRAFVVDAFCEKAFAGNPAAVVLLDGERDDAWRSAVAREYNLSETAFVEEQGAHFRLRWFTPSAEVGLCGHATLAAAHVLWETGRVPAERPVVFDTRAGVLTARREAEFIVLDLPARPVALAKPPAGFVKVFGAATPVWLGENEEVFLAEMHSEDDVRAAAPDLTALMRLTKKGLLITASTRRKTYDFVSRCFFPADGILEDPVTGSAHCALGPYWAERLKKPVLWAVQASARGGQLLVRPKDGRVEVGGKAVLVSRGELLA